MTSPFTKARVTGYAPVRQWIVPLAILGIAFLLRMSAPGSIYPYYAIYVSLLMLAFMQPVINALRSNFLQNLGPSVLIFTIHAAMCYGAFRMMNGMSEFNVQLFGAILVFYFMATFLSLLFRGIYRLLLEA